MVSVQGSVGVVSNEQLSPACVTPQLHPVHSGYTHRRPYWYVTVYPCGHCISDICLRSALGFALLQHQQAGILPSSTEAPLEALPSLDPIASTSMPESWVRGAMLIRMNSLIRGHSGVRWELIQKMGDLLQENITPMVPLRGSISASGGQCLYPQRLIVNIAL